MEIRASVFFETRSKVKKAFKFGAMEDISFFFAVRCLRPTKMWAQPFSQLNHLNLREGILRSSWEDLRGCLRSLEGRT